MHLWAYICNRFPGRLSQLSFICSLILLVSIGCDIALNKFSTEITGNDAIASTQTIQLCLPDCISFYLELKAVL